MADSRDFGSNQNNNIDKDIAELLKKRATDNTAWQTLRQKYGNDQALATRVFEKYSELLKKIYKNATEFKRRIFERYAPQNYSYNDILKKAKKYQKKHGLSDSEFDMFMYMALTDKSSKYIPTIPVTMMSKTLGVDAIAQNSKLQVKPDEMSIVEEIIAKFGETKPLHAQVVLQSLTYPKDSISPETLSGRFDPLKQNAYAYINPVLMAMFGPKFDDFEELMLMANIGSIVKSKHSGESINTYPDFKLYTNFINDPNDGACVINNPIMDLKHRFNLQTKIWDAVFNLRQGKYYYNDTSCTLGFMQALENCRNIIHDAPDLTYVRDEGTIMRRIMSAFSMYPTYVSVNSLINSTYGPQYGNISVSPYEMTGLRNITKVPIITLRLPLSTISGSNTAISLEDALSQPQWFVENKQLVPKSLQILHSGGVLIFHVNRRYQTINIARTMIPCNFNRLPRTETGWEALNPYPVNAPRSMNIMNDIFELASVVVVDKTEINGKDLIVGSSALMIAPYEPASGIFEETFFVYDPQGAGVKQYDSTGGRYINENPIKVIPGTASYTQVSGAKIESFEHKASTRGTLFLYRKQTDVPCNIDSGFMAF